MGFLSLIPSKIQVFIEFGFFTSLGVFYAFSIAYWVLPIFLNKMLSQSKHNKLKHALHQKFDVITPKKIYPKVTLIISAILFVLFIWGTLLVQKNSLLHDDMHAKGDSNRAIKSIAYDFYGIRDVSLAITVKDTSKKIIDFDILKKIEKIQSIADSIYGLKIPMSLVTSFSQLNRAKNGGRAEFLVLPTSEKEMSKLWKTVKKDKLDYLFNPIISKDQKSTFIYGKIFDHGSATIANLNNRFTEVVKQEFDELEVTITGGSNVLDQTTSSVTNTMIMSLVIILLAIVLLISIIHKSIKIGLLSIIPNIIPLIALSAVVGWFNLGLSVSTTIVFTIVLGIAVDDTIHFLSRYRIETKKNISKDEAIINCIKTSGGAISLTTIILTLGFGTLIFSDFHSNYLTGLLVTIGLIVAVLCDLFFLPLVLRYLK